MKSERTVWAVAYVWRGLSHSVELFADESSAQRHVDAMRETMQDEDEVGVYAVTVPREPIHS